MASNEHVSAERLQALLEGDLPRRERARVEEHVAECVHCSAELESWHLLFEDLAALPSHRPRGAATGAFVEGVMAGVDVPRPTRLAARLRAGLAALLPASRPEHIAAGTLQDLADGALPARTAARAEAHLAGCGVCSQELEAWQTVLGRLSTLERFEPGGGFTGRVMAALRRRASAPSEAREPAWQRVLGGALATATGFVPRTRRAWAAISGVAVTPAVVLGLVLYAVFSHPTLTPSALVSFALWQLADLAGAAWDAALALGIDAAGALGVGPVLGTLADAPMVVASGVLAYSVVFALAVRVLYHNIIRSRSLSGRHVRVSHS